jgi:hypothetical protein
LNAFCGGFGISTSSSSPRFDDNGIVRSSFGASPSSNNIAAIRKPPVTDHIQQINPPKSDQTDESGLDLSLKL